MQQTEQYGLNQWELTDQIKMADFNADNAKIDTALAGKMGKPEILLEVSYTDGFSSSAYTPMRGSWSDWSFCGIYFLPLSTPHDDSALTVYANRNRIITTTNVVPFIVLYYPLHDPSRRVQGMMIGSSVTPFIMEETFAEFDYGRIVANHFDSAYSITTFGIR